MGRAFIVERLLCRRALDILTARSYILTSPRLNSLSTSVYITATIASPDSMSEVYARQQ